MLYSNYSAISLLENVGIEKIMNIHKTQSTSTHEYLRNRKLTWFFVVTWTCSYEEHQIMDSSTSKALRMKKYFIKKGFFIFPIEGYAFWITQLIEGIKQSIEYLKACWGWN